jgi:hypothetical protein
MNSRERLSCPSRETRHRIAHTRTLDDPALVGLWALRSVVRSLRKKTVYVESLGGPQTETNRSISRRRRRDVAGYLEQRVVNRLPPEMIIRRGETIMRSDEMIVPRNDSK